MASNPSARGDRGHRAQNDNPNEPAQRVRWRAAAVPAASSSRSPVPATPCCRRSALILRCTCDVPVSAPILYGCAPRGPDRRCRRPSRHDHRDQKSHDRLNGQAKGGNMTDPTTTNPDDSKVGAELDEAAVATFKDSLRGELMGPDDFAYKDARMIWNRLIDKRPALIARCADANDVVRSVRFAREHELAVAVRGGGHNIAGNCVCDGGLMIDLSQMKGIRVDRERRTARAQPGLTFGQFDRHTQAHGLATDNGHRLGGGHRRPHPRRRLWLACRQVRPGLRQPALGGAGDRRGRAAERQRGRERRTVLGRARRRCELRCDHILRVPASPSRQSAWRHGAVRANAGRPAVF